MMPRAQRRWPQDIRTCYCDGLTPDLRVDEAKPVAEALVFYLPLLEQTHEPHANRLQMMQRELVALQISDAAKLRQLEEGHPNVGQMRLESIIDPEPVNTRANFLVHLDGLVSAVTIMSGRD